jgi:hypothetical protein
MAVTRLPLLPSNGRLFSLLGVTISVISSVRCSAHTLFVFFGVTLSVLTSSDSMYYVKSKSHYDRRSVGHSVLVSSPIWGPKRRFLLLSEICCFVDVGRPLRREDGSVICRGHSQQDMTTIFTSLLVGNLHSHLSRVRFLAGTYYLQFYM